MNEERKYCVAISWQVRIEAYRAFFSFENFKNNRTFASANSIFNTHPWLTRKEAESLCCEVVKYLRAQGYENSEYSLVILEDLKTNFNNYIDRAKHFEEVNKSL